jgi:hypothetical protein
VAHIITLRVNKGAASTHGLTRLWRDLGHSRPTLELW